MRSCNLNQNRESNQPSDNTTHNTGERTLSLLQKIRAGVIDPKCIGPGERRLIVGYLLADGYSIAEMAQILKVSESTIKMDKKAIREENAIRADPQLVEKMVGRLVFEAELCVQRIRKIARDKDTQQVVRIQAEHRCYRIISDVISSMQRLGYLPTATARLQADFTHTVSQVPEFSQMQAEVQRLRQIAGETKETNPELAEQLNEIEAQLGKVKLVERIENISKVIESKEVQNE